ncbi:hypothetical protein VPH35_112479 [Triticum aestivum]
MPPLLAPATGSSWASLPEDLVRHVGWRLLAGNVMDYVRLGAVCTNWRSATMSTHGRGVIDPRFHPRRWMMFEDHGLYSGHERLGEHTRSFNLDSGVFVRVRLPLFKDHCVLDSVESLLLLHRDEDTAIRLLHPFTGDIVELPPLASHNLHMSHPYANLPQLRRISASVSIDAEVVRVMVIFIHLMYAAVATSQDTNWTFLMHWRLPSHYGSLSFQGNPYEQVLLPGFALVQYLVHQTMNMENINLSQIFQLEAHSQDPPKLIVTFPMEKLCYPIYLVECDSEILVVGHNDISLTHLAVYKLADVVLDRFIPVKSIGDKTIFVGGRNLCVSSKALPTISNILCNTASILAVGLYSLATDECSTSGLEQGPCSLILHVFTCCSRDHWNKRQMCYLDKLSLTWKRKEIRDGA